MTGGIPPCAVCGHHIADHGHLEGTRAWICRACVMQDNARPAGETGPVDPRHRYVAAEGER